MGCPREARYPLQLAQHSHSGRWVVAHREAKARVVVARVRHGIGAAARLVAA